jgi:hypothetical protein
MRKLKLFVQRALLAALTFFASNSYGQLANGSVLPAGINLTDLNGNSYNIDALISGGKTIFIDVSATWCGPCWGFHQTHILDDLYTQYGPQGTDEVRVFWIEGDATTSVPLISGIGTNTQGDWTAGTTFPICDDADAGTTLQIGFFPTLYMICPSRRVWHISPSEVGSYWPVSQHIANARACSNPIDAVLDSYTGETSTCGTLSPLKVNIQNKGLQTLTSANITASIGGTQVAFTNWTGALEQFQASAVSFGSANITSSSDLTFTVTPAGTDAAPSNNSLVQTIDLAPFVTSANIIVKITTDQYGTESSWKIRKSNNAVVASGGPYTDLTSVGTTVQPNVSVTLPANDCYSFEMLDAYGDGMFTAYGQGGYQVTTSTGTVILSGGEFGAIDKKRINYNYVAPISLGNLTNNGISNNNPNPITFSINPTGCSSFTYQWYSAPGFVSAPTGSSTFGWTLIPGATSNTYDPPTLFNSTSYACFVTPLSSCGNAAWAGGVASFTITTSSGSVNGQQVSQCTSSSVPLTFDSQPVGFGNTSYQWYFVNGSVSCPQGNATSGWTAIAGATSSTSSFVPPSSGTYTLACLVTPEGNTGLPSQWANGCKTVIVNNFTAQSIIGNPNITPFNPYTYLVSQVSGHTYSWTAYGGAVSSGQNTNQVSVIWAATGPYQVMLIENNGVCSDTSYLDVVGSSCALTVNVISIDPTTFCANGQARLIANASSGVSYQWKLNGNVLPNETNDTLLVTASGSYQVVAVLDASCSAISQPISLTELPIPTPPQIQMNGSPTNCNSQPPTLTVLGNYSSFQWNTGETTSSITVNTSGDYSVSAIDANGCTAQSSISTINLALLPPVSICVATVDSLTGHNIIVWEKPATTLIDSFIVYKESVVADVYERIGSQPYAQLSTFLDAVSNPLVQSSRYKLGLVDTCGSESSLSTYHKTMHLSLNLGVGGTVNLIWEGYQGLNFGSYNIYRGTSPENMIQLATIQSNLSSYTDLTPPSGAVFYQMEIVIPGCNPTAISYLRSRSNIANTGTIGFEQLNLDDVRVFPNPTDVGFTIQSNAILADESIELLDQVGRVVTQINAAVNSTYVSTAHLAKGIYFLRLPSHPGYSRKLIVN